MLSFQCISTLDKRIWYEEKRKKNQFIWTLTKKKRWFSAFFFLLTIVVIIKSNMRDRKRNDEPQLFVRSLMQTFDKKKKKIITKTWRAKRKKNQGRNVPINGHERVYSSITRIRFNKEREEKRRGECSTWQNMSTFSMCFLSRRLRN